VKARPPVQQSQSLLRTTTYDHPQRTYFHTCYTTRFGCPAKQPNESQLVDVANFSIANFSNSVAEVRFSPVLCHILANTEHEHPPVWVNRTEPGPNTVSGPKLSGSGSVRVRTQSKGENCSKVNYMVDNSLVLYFGLHYFVLYKYYSLPSDFLACFVPVRKVRFDCKKIRLHHLPNSDNPLNRRIFLNPCLHLWNMKECPGGDLGLNKHASKLQRHAVRHFTCINLDRNCVKF
jgi:hypothetical protein